MPLHVMLQLPLARRVTWWALLILTLQHGQYEKLCLLRSGRIWRRSARSSQTCPGWPPRLETLALARASRLFRDVSMTICSHRNPRNPCPTSKFLASKSGPRSRVVGQSPSLGETGLQLLCRAAKLCDALICCPLLQTRPKQLRDASSIPDTISSNTA